MRRFFAGFGYAAQGFWAAVKEERNLRFHLCAGAYVLAASLYALAGFYGADASQNIQQLKAGDLTIYQDGVKQDARVRNLQNQAWEILRPFLSDGFSFAGV